MPDVGDFRTPTLTVNPFDGTTVATLSVVAPNGTATAVAVASSGGGASWAATAPYEFTAEGVWVERWTVTGTGKGREFAYEIAVGVALPAQLPEALAHIGHLVARLGRSLTASEKLRAPAMLGDASDEIRGFCRRQFTPAVNDELVIRPVGNVITLPNRPVTSVDSVEVIGTGGTADLVLGVDNWAFDGIDRIELYAYPVPITGAVPTGTYANTYRIVYDHGGTVPTPIVGRICKMVFRTLLAPTTVEGLVSERIGQYMYQYGQFPGGQSPGPTVELTDADEKWLRKMGYRSSASTIQLRT
jgi:hypothetical protein